MFEKIFNMAHSRKFMFAKIENFANFSIRESFCLRMFLPLKYVVYNVLLNFLRPAQTLVYQKPKSLQSRVPVAREN